LSSGTIQQALVLKTQTEALFTAEGFELNKWAGLHEALCPDGDNTQKLFSDSQTVGVLRLFGTQDKIRWCCEQLQLGPIMNLQND